MDFSPIISIGMPIRNNGMTISVVINSILAQSYSNFELIISDNNSSDDTSEICMRHLSIDKRIKYFRQDEYLTGPQNFDFVRSKSCGKYFMWAAGDDIRSINFLQNTVSILESFPECVAATELNIIDGNEKMKPVDFSLEGDKIERIKVFFDNCWSSQALFYSLVRIDAAKSWSVENLDMMGGDWGFILHLLHKGKVMRSDKGVSVFGAGGASSSPEIWRLTRKSLINWLAPFFGLSKFSINLLKDLPFHEKVYLIIRLIKLNLFAAKMQLLTEIYLIYCKNKKIDT